MNYSDFYRNRFFRITAASCASVLLIAVAAAEHSASAQTTATAALQVGETQKADPNRLEVTEELSESLANDLLELSAAARDRNLQATGEYFPAETAAKHLLRYSPRVESLDEVDTREIYQAFAY